MRITQPPLVPVPVWVRASLAIVALGVAVTLVACGPGSPSVDGRLQQVDEIFSAQDSEETPGCVAAASRDGEILFERAWGMANLELGVPLDPVVDEAEEAEWLGQLFIS